jgi:hypothetical protein
MRRSTLSSVIDQFSEENGSIVCANAEQFAKLFPDTAFRHSRLQDSPHPFIAGRTPNLANCIRSATNFSDGIMTKRWVRWPL